MRLRRRDLLTTLAVLATPSIWSRAAGAIGPKAEVGVGVIAHGGRWDHRPEVVRRLLWEAGKRTSINVARERSVVRADDDGSAEATALYWQPLLVLSGEGPLPPFSEVARRRLEKHLRFGGLLLVDAPSPSDPFAADAQRELAAILPGITPTRLAKDHVVMKSFFLVPKATGRLAADDGLLGMDIGDRTAVIISNNDLLGAWERDRFGTWRFECEPDGDSQREMAFRLGVNILMVATCLDYKEDQVHIPFIMKKKRR